MAQLVSSDAALGSAAMDANYLKWTKLQSKDERSYNVAAAALLQFSHQRMGVLDFLSAVDSRDRSIFSFITSLLSPLLLPERSIYRVVCKMTLYVGHSLILCFWFATLSLAGKCAKLGTCLMTSLHRPPCGPSFETQNLRLTAVLSVARKWADLFNVICMVTVYLGCSVTL
jgi:hypothetical protein